MLDKRVAKKRYIFDFYKKAFADIEDIHMMPVDRDSVSNCWLTCITLTGSKVKPLDILLALEKENIEARPIWKPLHLQPVFEGCDFIGEERVSEKIFDSGVCLPSDTKMTDEELERAASIVKGLWK